MAMKFGKQQRSKPTPKRVEQLFDMMASLLGIISGFIVVAAFIPKPVSDAISPVITALLIPVCLQLKKYFGSDTVEQEDAPETNQPQ